MLKDCRNKTLEVGDVASIQVMPGNIISGVVQEVSPPLSVPGGPPQGIQKVRILAVIELPPVPANSLFTGIAVLDKNGTEGAKEALDILHKLMDEMRVGSGTSTILAG